MQLDHYRIQSKSENFLPAADKNRGRNQQPGIAWRKDLKHTSLKRNSPSNASSQSSENFHRRGGGKSIEGRGDGGHQEEQLNKAQKDLTSTETVNTGPT